MQSIIKKRKLHYAGYCQKKRKWLSQRGLRRRNGFCLCYPKRDFCKSRSRYFFPLPDSGRNTVSFQEELPLQANDLSDLLNYCLLTLNPDHIPFSIFSDVSKDLSDRLEHVLYDQESFEKRIFQLKTRQYTYTRISRCLLHILLGITDEMVSAGKKAGYALMPVF